MDALRELSEQAGEPMQTVLDKAIEAYRRECFLRDANADYRALRADRDAWAEVLKERDLLENANADGLDGE